MSEDSESPERHEIGRTVELSSEPTEMYRILPDTKVVKVGGQSVMDRGRAALYPLVDEIAACAKDHHILIGAGGGTRARHAYAVGLDLELPTGVMARLGGAVPMQNARMLQMLLAKHGGVFILHEDFEKLPLYFMIGGIPVISGMPPHEYWEKPMAGTRIPQNRTDAGVFLAAEALGCDMVYFAKDERGLFTADPKKDPGAEFIPETTVSELMKRDLDDLIIERVVFTYLSRAIHCRAIHVFNGLERGNLTRALNGEHVGTIIRAD